MTEKAFEMAKNSLVIEQKAVADVLETLDRASFEKAVEALSACRQVITSASGSSGIAAKKFSHTLCCIERPAQFLPPCEAMHGGLGAVQKDTVVVLVSRGGKTAELLPILDVAKKKGAFIIGICENLIRAVKIGGVSMTTFSDAFTFALLIVVLCVKPNGLFGEKTTEKV